MNNLLRSFLALSSVAMLSSCVNECASSDKPEARDAKTLKLTSPCAPFAEKKVKAEGKTESFKPETKTDRIIFGNKELKINDDGTLGIYANGSRLAKLFYYYKTNNYVWITPEDKKRFKRISSKSDPGKGFYEYKAEFPLEKPGGASMPMGKYSQTVSLLKDGRIKVDILWSVPKGFEKSVKGDCYFISFPATEIKGEKIIVDGKNYFVPEQEKYGFFKVDKPKKITMFPDSKDKTFTIEPTACEYALGWSQKKKGHVRLWADKKQKQLTFILNISKGIKKQESKDTYAGIDFQKVEALEMPDFKSSKNLMRNPSFEQGLKDYRIAQYVGYAIDEKEWKDFPYQEDNKKAKFGASSLKIKTFCKKRAGDYRALIKPGNVTSLPVPLEPGEYTLSFYAKGNRAPNQEISAWCPNACWFGNAYLPLPKAKKIFKITDKWARYSITFDVPKAMPFQANFNAISKTGDGSIWIDGLQLEHGKVVTAFETRPVEGRLVTSEPGNFLSSKDRMRAKLKVFAKANASGKAKVMVKNFFGEKLFDNEFKCKTDKDGQAEIELPFDGKFADGIYVVKAEYALDGGGKTYDLFRFSIMDFLENKHRLKNIFADQYGRYSGNPNFLKILDRWRKIGIGAKNHMHVRDKKIAGIYKKYGVKITDDFMMSLYRKRHKKGKLYFQIKTDLVGTDRKSGKVLINDFRMENKDGKLTDDYVQRFENAVETVAKKCPWINMWAFGGENGAKWSEFAGTSASNEEFKKFVRLQIAFYKGVKKGNPNAKVFNGDPCNMRPDGGIKLIDRLLTAIDGKIKYDLIGIHPYRATPENPDLDSDVVTLLKMLGKHGYKDTPVFFPEGMHWGPYNIPQWGIVSATWGPPRTWYYGALSYDMGWTEKVTAAWRARSWLVALKYQDRVKSFMSASFQNNFDIDVDLTPFATQKISNTLGNLLGDAHFKKDIRFAPYTRCYVFEDTQKRPVAAVWNFHPKVDAGKINAPLAEANFKGQDIEVFDLMQARRIPKKDEKGNVIFPASSFPLFFRGEPGGLDKMLKSFKDASLISGEGIAPVTIAGRPASADKMFVTLRNMLSRKFAGNLSVNGKNKSVLAPPSSSANIEFDLPKKLKADKVVEEKIEAIITSGKSRFCNDLSFRGFICRKTAKPISVDGNIDDWKNIPSITFRNRSMRDKNRKKVSNDDFSGVFKAAWDERGIYLCVKIKDDQFSHEEYKKTSQRWNNDSLQVYFDTLCDARLRETFGYDRNDYDYLVLPSSNGAKSIVFRNHSPDRQLTFGTEAPDDNTVEPNIKSAFRKTSDGYVYEVAFPAKYLLPINLNKGASFGFSLFVNDKDGGKNTESSLTLTPNRTGSYNKPHLWPVMLLWE